MLPNAVNACLQSSGSDNAVLVSSEEVFPLISANTHPVGANLYSYRNKMPEKRSTNEVLPI